MKTHAEAEFYQPGIDRLVARDHVVPVPWEDDAVQLNVAIQGPIVKGLSWLWLETVL